MRNYLNYAFSLMLMPVLIGCGVENSSKNVSESNIIDGAFIPARQETNFNVYINMGDSNCSGSLISPTFVLTAAHCLVGKVPSEISLVADSEVETGPTVKTNLPSAKALHVHPLYTGGGDDIALIELASPADAKFKPTTIYNDSVPQGNFFTVEAYGYSPYIWSNFTDLLGYVRNEVPEIYPGNIDVFGKTRLQGKAIPASASPGSDFITLYQPNGGVCSGDSGGPIMLDMNGKKVQIGITTSGVMTHGLTNCNTLGMVTQVSKYLPWIESTMGAAKKSLKKQKYPKAADIFELNTNDKKCIVTQLNAFAILVGTSEQIIQKTCVKDVVEALEMQLELSKVLCTSELTSTYPKTLNMTVQKLKKDCK